MRKVNLLLISLITLVTLSVGLSSCGGASDVDAGYNFILNQLNSPQTASLKRGAYNSDVKLHVEEQCKVQLPSCISVGQFEVTAQNSFGGMVTTMFYVFYKNGKPCCSLTADDLATLIRSGTGKSLTGILNSKDCGC